MVAFINLPDQIIEQKTLDSPQSSPGSSNQANQSPKLGTIKANGGDHRFGPFRKLSCRFDHHAAKGENRTTTLMRQDTGKEDRKK